MYEVLKKINANTNLVMHHGCFYIMKKIFSQDVPVYKKLMTINNKNVAKIIDLTLIENDFYVIEEYIQGITLNEYIKNNGILDDIKVKNFSLDICNGLDAIHNLSIVHRDINPNNIIINQKEQAVIIDFGISRCEKVDCVNDTQILGTQGYAAPEQYGFSQTTAKSDIYAVGVLINYMKTGCMPNEKVTQGRFGKIVTKCTKIDENNRYNNVNELALDISEKNRGIQFIRKIPGFRKNIWWHSAIACLYYAAVIFFLFISIDIGENIKQKVFYFLFSLFCFVFTVPVLTNAGNWLQRLSFSKNQTKSFQIFIQIVISCVLCLIGCVFIYYI